VNRHCLSLLLLVCTCRTPALEWHARSLCCRGRIASCAKGRGGRINRRIDSLVEIVPREAETSQIIDRIAETAADGNTALIELTPHLEQQFGWRVVVPVRSRTTPHGGLSLGQEQQSTIEERPSDICFTPESGHQLSAFRCPLSATNGLTHRSKIATPLDHLIGTAKVVVRHSCRSGRK
jgi:hypothetical protein